jgi:hypothetical protein
MAEFPFSKIKLQHLLEMAKDECVNDRAFRLLVYLALAHADKVTGACFPSDRFIAKAMGKSEKTVSRAASDLAASGRYDVERGVNRGKATLYRPTEATLAKAVNLKNKADKIVMLSGHKARQNCPQSPTDVSPKARQRWGANREQEQRKEQAGVSATDLPNGGQSGTADLYAGMIDAGKRIFGGPLSDKMRCDLIERGYTLDQIRRAEAAA